MQRINHFPNNKQLHNKGIMGKNLNAIARLLPAEFNFHPRTYNMPEELPLLKEWVASRDPSPDGEPWTYIIKPTNKIQGRGIRLTMDPVKEMAEGKKCVVQVISWNPLPNHSPHTHLPPAGLHSETTPLGRLQVRFACLCLSLVSRTTPGLRLWRRTRPAVHHEICGTDRGQHRQDEDASDQLRHQQALEGL